MEISDGPLDRVLHIRADEGRENRDCAVFLATVSCAKVAWIFIGITVMFVRNIDRCVGFGEMFVEGMK